MNTLAERVEHRMQMTELCIQMSKLGIHVDRRRRQELLKNFDKYRLDIFPHYKQKRASGAIITVWEMGFNPQSVGSIRKWLAERDLPGFPNLRNSKKFYVKAMREAGYHPDEEPLPQAEALYALYLLMQYREWSSKVLNWLSPLPPDDIIHPRWSAAATSTGAIKSSRPSLPPGNRAGWLSRSAAIPHHGDAFLSEIVFVPQHTPFENALLTGSDVQWIKTSNLDLRSHLPTEVLPWKIGDYQAVLTGSRLSAILYGWTLHHLRRDAIQEAMNAADTWMPVLEPLTRQLEGGMLKCPGGIIRLHGDLNARWKTACSFAYRANRVLETQQAMLSLWHNSGKAPILVDEDKVLYSGEVTGIPPQSKVRTMDYWRQ